MTLTLLKPTAGQDRPAMCDFCDVPLDRCQCSGPFDAYLPTDLGRAQAHETPRIRDAHRQAASNGDTGTCRVLRGILPDLNDAHEEYDECDCCHMNLHECCCDAQDEDEPFPLTRAQEQELEDAAADVQAGGPPAAFREAFRAVHEEAGRPLTKEEQKKARLRERVKIAEQEVCRRNIPTDEYTRAHRRMRDAIREAKKLGMTHDEIYTRPLW